MSAELQSYITNIIISCKTRPAFSRIAGCFLPSFWERLFVTRAVFVEPKTRT